MLNSVTDFLVNFRCAGRPPRSLALGQLLLELRDQGVDPYLLEDITGSLARDGFFFGHHNYRRFAVFLPVSDSRSAAGLLIVVREGSVRSLLSDSPIDATIVDGDYDPARYGETAPEVVSPAEFQRIRAAVLSELVDSDGAEDAQPATAEEQTPHRLAS